MVHVVQNVELQCMTFSETRFQFPLRLIFKKGQITVLFSTRKTVCGSKFVAKIYWDWQWQAESSIRFWNFTLSRAVLAKLALPNTLFGKLYPLFILYKWRKTYTSSLIFNPLALNKLLLPNTWSFSRVFIQFIQRTAYFFHYRFQTDTPI